MIYDIVIVGGGPAGLAAAIKAKKNGVDKILLIERSSFLGGILNQCIHNGFGLHTFKQELTGPEYAAKYINEFNELNIPKLLDTTVLAIKNKQITYVNEEGLVTIESKSIILAMGCRERSRGALNIPGNRPSGIYSAGAAQSLVNIDGLKIGSRVVILGSGDIGLIMARRLTLEGYKVLAVAEKMPYSGGLKRNIVQCLEDYDIPLLLSHTVSKIYGKDRLKGIELSEVDDKGNIIKGSEMYFDCDTLLLSVGLVPENELSRSANIEMNSITSGPIVDDRLETSVDGVFACGNVLHVHDLVDFVSKEAENAADNACRYIGLKNTEKCLTLIKPMGIVRYVVPNMIDIKQMEDEITLYYRVNNVYKNKIISIFQGHKEIFSLKKQVLLPGEMEKIKLKKNCLNNSEEIIIKEVE